MVQAGVTLHVDNLVDDYVDVVNYVYDNGHEVCPRGIPTKELLGAVIVVDNPQQCLPLGVGRKVSTAVAAVETLQLIGGFTDPALTCRASSEFEKVRDGGAFHGAYGPRAAPQFPRVIDRLHSDPASRRAVVNIWDPAYDLYRKGLQAYPCTVSLEYTIRDGELIVRAHVSLRDQLSIRDGELIAQTHMRSNDVWLGLAYDAFVFTQVQLTIAQILGVPAGPYIHHASSLHLYEAQYDLVPNLMKSKKEPWLPEGMHTGLSWGDAAMLAHGIVYWDPGVQNSKSRAWYENALKDIK